MAMVLLASIIEPDGTLMLLPALSETDEPPDWTVTPEFTVKLSNGGESGAAASAMAPAEKMFASIVSGLPELMVTLLVPVPVALIGPVTVMPCPSGAVS
jgi:hypothetical protein